MFNNNKIKRNWRSSDAKKFLTFTANTAGSTVKLSSFHEDSIIYNGSTLTVPVECKCPYLLSLEYSTNGINWQAYNFSEVYDENDNLIGYDGQTITLPRVGDFLIIRATRSNANLNPNGGWSNWFTGKDSRYLPPTGWYQFVLSGSVAASGNLQSLIYKNLNGQTGIGQFYRLFKNCTQLTTAPYLGAKILRNQIYRETFMGCTNIEEVESEPNLQNGGEAGADFISMFEGCTSLNRFTNIHVTKGWNGSYGGDDLTRMFFGCSSLEEIPLYDTTLNEVQDGSYRRTFEGCISLIDASEYRMYQPHTTVYHSGVRTFYGCTSLKYPPYLNKAILNVSWGNGNEELKFAGCSSLKEIIYNSQELPQYTDTSAAWTRNWVNGVPSTGNFFIGKNCPKIYSKNFIPYGWDINEIDDRPLTFEAETANCQIRLKKEGEIQDEPFSYSLDGGTTWQRVVFDEWITLSNIGDTVCFTNMRREPTFSHIHIAGNVGHYRFECSSSQSKIKCYGNVYTMLRRFGVFIGVNSPGVDEYYMLYGLFGVMRGSVTTMPTIPDYPFTLPAQAFGLWFMSDNKNIDQVVLKFKKSKFQWNCFYRTFQGSTNLHTVILKIRSDRFVNSDNGVFSQTFSKCTALTKVGVYFNTWGNGSNIRTLHWLQDASSNGTFICPKGLNTSIRDDSHIPDGWTVKHWYEEIGEQYPSVAALMQQYTDLEDVVDTYPDVAPILDQYPNLVHSLVDTGQRPYVTFGTGMWKVDVYPHNYMEATLHYNKVASDNCFGIWSRRGTSGSTLALFHTNNSQNQRLQMLFGATGSGENPQGIARYGGTGEHKMYISKDSATFDGVEAIKDAQIKLGDFDASYYLSDKIQIEGNSDRSGTTTTAKLYSIEIKEYGTLTHRYVPVADGVIADIADLDEVKIYTKDDATAVFGLE